MEYHHPQMYHDYYCPPCPFPSYHPNQMLHQQQAPAVLKNIFNNNLNNSQFHGSQYHHLQHSQPYMPRSHHPSNTTNLPHSSASSMFVPNFLVSSGTGLTPTLTPTTLINLEQSFLDETQNNARDPTTQSGFVPPVVDPANSADQSQDSLDYSSSDDYDDSSRHSRKRHYDDDVKAVDLIVTSTGTINAAPQRKYRRRNKDEKLPPEEEERRRVRRERNKVAAAKCRQRRVDHTNVLVEETEQLEEEHSKLELEIQRLQQERDQLEFVLQAHQPMCKVGKSKVKPEPKMAHHTDNNCSISHTQNLSSCPAPENLSKSAVAASSAGISSLTTSRPNSLPLIKRDRARMMSVTSATGVTINTPTSGVTITPSALFCPGLETMVDGSTGLTPLNGLSCSSQVQHRTNSDSGSEAVGSPTLISL